MLTFTSGSSPTPAQRGPVSNDAFFLIMYEMSFLRISRDLKGDRHRIYRTELFSGLYLRAWSRCGWQTGSWCWSG